MRVPWIDDLEHPYGTESGSGLWVWRVQTGSGVRSARRTAAGDFAGWADGHVHVLRSDPGASIAGAGAGAIAGAVVGGLLGAMVGALVGGIVASRA